MDFLHKEVQANRGDVVEVTLDTAANVRLVDTHNFNRFKDGDDHQAIGAGFYRRSPVRIAVPSSGRWVVVVDLAGRAGNIRTGVRVLRH